VVRVGAEGAAAVGHDLAVGRQLGQAVLELGDRDRTRALDVPGGVLLAGADVDEHDVAAAQTLDELVAADLLDVLAQVLAGCPFHLGEPCDGGVPQRQPDGQRLGAGEGVADARALARARDHAGRVQRLEMLGGVRRRLFARSGELVDRARCLGEQVEQLKAARAGEGLAHQRDRLEQRVFFRSSTHR
jgi:hypothetical protein